MVINKIASFKHLFVLKARKLNKLFFILTTFLDINYISQKFLNKTSSASLFPGKTDNHRVVF